MYVVRTRIVTNVPEADLKDAIEIYDGPHYYEKPVFHTDATIGGFLAKKS